MDVTTLQAASRIAKRQALARAVLSQLPPSPPGLTASPLAPTVTLTSNTTTGTISSAVRIAPARSSTTVINSSTDPSFTWVGAPQGVVAVSSADMARPGLLTGGAGQAARWRPRIRFWHTGQAVEVYLRTPSTTLAYRLWVNGQPVTTSLQVSTVVATNRHAIKIDFGSVDTRLVEFEGEDVEFGGVFIEPTGTISRGPVRPLLGVFGDSITGGANGGSNGCRWPDAWGAWCGQWLGMDVVNMAIGGSGFIAAPAFSTRSGDIAAAAPDILVVFGGYNDAAGNSGSAIQTAASTFLAACRAALPTAPIFAVGPWLLGQTNQPTLTAADDGVKAAALASGMPSFSLHDPEGLKGSTTAWTASTAYVVGDSVLANGLVQKCIVGYAGGGAFDQS
jgi:hypothetical protein